jgi:hypothetical protein
MELQLSDEQKPPFISSGILQLSSEKVKDDPDIGCPPFKGTRFFKRVLNCDLRVPFLRGLQNEIKGYYSGEFKDGFL